MMSSRLHLAASEVPLTPESDYEELSFPDYHHDQLPSLDRLSQVDGNNSNLSTSYLPYMNVYQSYCGFSDLQRNVFIPGKPVECRMISVERNLYGNLISPHVYTLELKHGEFQWIIKRRYFQFLNLHRQLQMHRAGLKMAFGSRSMSDRRSFRAIARKAQQLPKFPIKPEASISGDRLYDRARQLERYLNAVLKCVMFRDYVEMLKFLEVSHLSFIKELGLKYKEGMVQKKAGDTRVVGYQALCMPIRGCFSRWLERWLVLKDTCLIIVRPKDGITREVLLMDRMFEVEVGFFQTGRWSGLTISNLNRKLTISGPSRERTDEWNDEIKLVMGTTGVDFIRPNRFDSFAPIRYETLAQWYIDGSGYFDAVANLLEGAKEEIFITDWMLSAELFLKRPIVDTDKWKLDKILQRKAEAGVKIFILLYKEVEFALSINSNYTRRKLVELHSTNIKVMRHPDHTPSGVMLWAHHEKLVIVDQTYAFVGGLDLCFGRWDDQTHRLIDLGGVNDLVPVPGQKFIRSSFTVANLTNALQSVALAPLTAAMLPGTDVVDHAIKLQSPPKSDVDSRKHIWPGKDYMNFIYKDFSDLESPDIDLIDRSEVVRMPWHDIAAVIQGKAACDAARHFIQRWNAVKIEKFKDNIAYPLLLPKSYKLLYELPPVITRMKPVTCQVIRSCSSWSAGVAITENSIEQAYVKTILESQHFIYIENQFFISLTGTSNYVSNKVAASLFDRILRAHKEKKPFKVYVVMPLLPAFEGQLGTNTGVALQAITHWNYASICRGPNSLLGKLSKEVGDPTSYIIFCGLRTHSKGRGQPVSELVYVHSKMLIADDKVAIIGSANINDRSLRGDRDSEIAVIIEDVDTYESRLGGKSWQAGRFVGTLRKQLFREHLGLLGKPFSGIDIVDPVTDAFFKEVWLKCASRNTSIFEKVFRCVPNDHILNFSQLKEYTKISPMSETNPEEAFQLLEGIRGNVVLIPLHFLSEETLTPPPSSKEALMPNSVWT